MRAPLLQLCPLTPFLEGELSRRFDVHRLHDIPDAPAFLDRSGAGIRAIVTGGHVGLPSGIAPRLPALEIVAINGVGFDKVDLGETRRRGIAVSNTPDVLTDDVADLAIGLMIDALRGVSAATDHVRQGRWPTAERPLGRRASGRAYGIVGLGRIGKAIGRRLEGFGGTVHYHNRSPADVPYRYHASLNGLAAAVDVLFVSLAASAETARLIGRDVLEALGPRGLLVNVARGSVVDEDALVAALVTGSLGGAALDVVAGEPHVRADMLAAPNLLVTPHIASATADTRRAMAELVLANLDAHFSGAPLPTPVL
jgi:lactate dehydrogenase-like 2-hydroxyacid dehydrogenase